MAQVLKEEIEKKIYKAAIDEFYMMGYQSATLRNIAKKAGIPVGLVYTYYKNKAALFAAVVNPTYLSFQKMLSKSSLHETNLGYDKFFQEELPFIFTMLKNDRKPFIILIDKSKGTIYENASEKIIQLTQIHIKKQIQYRIGQSEKMDDLFYHILANNFMEGLFEIARHYKNEKWAINIMKLFMQQYFYGIKAIIN
ncbi:MAG: TetR/AcrR family transcriptional regulator [Acidaminococcaceae bacterium]|nr:TetR/AcrR family transcriptional regulator [Acidaminococcaceae bacterium]MDD4721767.1 TetR/AcrR family transcriptional regulator [Acidaminococcaceae bacterium]